MKYTFLHPDIETRHLKVRKDDPKWLGYWMDFLRFKNTQNDRDILRRGSEQLLRSKGDRAF